MAPVNPPVAVDPSLLAGGAAHTPGAANAAQRAALEARALEFVERVVNRARLLRYPDRTEMTLDLSPPGLGHIQMHLVEDSGSFTVHLRADDAQVQQFLANHVEQLATKLEDQGYSVAVDVHQQSASGRQAQAQSDQGPMGRSVSGGPQDRQEGPTDSPRPQPGAWAPLSAQGVDYRV